MGFRGKAEHVRATSLSDISKYPGAHTVLCDAVVNAFSQKTSDFHSCPCMNRLL